jgi:hypothetical protein
MRAMSGVGIFLSSQAPETDDQIAVYDGPSNSLRRVHRIACQMRDELSAMISSASARLPFHREAQILLTAI